VVKIDDLKLCRVCATLERMSRSYVVTGGGRGVGRAVVDRLLAADASVVVIERDECELPPGARAVIGDASDEAVAERAADLAEAEGALAGWVNNAAVFRDASLHADSARTVLDLVAANLGLAVVGCAMAVRRFLAAGTEGAIVNVSSHQARQAVPGCTPYVTAKAAIEGLTRALAVEYGERGIRVNAVAPGTVDTGRFDEPTERALAGVHPLGRVARADEVAAVIAHLLSAEASFVTGATIPVDGGRTVLAHEPTRPGPLDEARRLR
jgi:NAD(P)-dependent dehydrogenase (short-subunit alcohol dehydrogenase family)